MENLSSNRSFGNSGEEKAAEYLAARGLIVVERQYRQKWGELDLICKDGKTWVFVEVKTRAALYFISAVHAVNFKKQQRMARAAFSYMKWKRLEGQAFRFDLVLIEAGQIEWIPDAFQLPARYTY